MKKLIKKSLTSVGIEISRVKKLNKEASEIASEANEIAFLHIGKNAGTQVMHVARQLTPHGVYIKKYRHNVKLASLPAETKYFFSIRNPSERFISGFYSRKRKGQPRIYSEWSQHEKAAFEEFEDANELAEMLFHENEGGVKARAAIKSIRHTGMQQVDWFQGCAYLNIQPPLTIIRQEFFEQDMQRFLDLLGVTQDLSSLLTEDKVKAHRNDYDEVPPLSELAVKNLKRWYIQDYMFYEMCEEWLKENKHIT